MKIQGILRKMAMAAAAVAFATAAHASTVSGVLGLNAAGGPYGTGFVQLYDMGSATIGAGGPELQRNHGPVDTFDFSSTGMTMSFNTGSNGALPFIGYVFKLMGLPGALTAVNLVSNSTTPYYRGKPALSQSDITIAPDGSGFAIALNSGYVGTAVLSFVFAAAKPKPKPGAGATIPSPVPLPAGLPLIGSALLMLGVARRRARG